MIKAIIIGFILTFSVLIIPVMAECNSCLPGQTLCHASGSSSHILGCIDLGGGCYDWHYVATPQNFCPYGCKQIGTGIGVCNSPPSKCSNICNVGYQKCIGNTVTSCVIGSNNCPEWSSDPNKNRVCGPKSECVESGAFAFCKESREVCKDECYEGMYICGIPPGYKGTKTNFRIPCGNFDTDPCLEYANSPSAILTSKKIQFCPLGCTQIGTGIAVCNTKPTKCPTDCLKGMTACDPNSNNVLTCKDYDNDGCNEWRDPKSSTAGQLFCPYGCETIGSGIARCGHPIEPPKKLPFEPPGGQTMDTLWGFTMAPQSPGSSVLAYYVISTDDLNVIAYLTKIRMEDFEILSQVDITKQVFPNYLSKYYPCCITTDGQYIYVGDSDSVNNTIYQFLLNGSYTGINSTIEPSVLNLSTDDSMQYIKGNFYHVNGSNITLLSSNFADLLNNVNITEAFEGFFTESIAYDRTEDLIWITAKTKRLATSYSDDTIMLRFYTNLTFKDVFFNFTEFVEKNNFFDRVKSRTHSGETSLNIRGELEIVDIDFLNNELYVLFERESIGFLTTTQELLFYKFTRADIRQKDRCFPSQTKCSGGTSKLEYPNPYILKCVKMKDGHYGYSNKPGDMTYCPFGCIFNETTLKSVCRNEIKPGECPTSSERGKQRQCTLGSYQCIGNTWRQNCIQSSYNANCYIWNESLEWCGVGSCKQGNCVACRDECKMGDSKCVMVSAKSKGLTTPATPSAEGSHYVVGCTHETNLYSSICTLWPDPRWQNANATRCQFGCRTVFDDKSNQTIASCAEPPTGSHEVRNRFNELFTWADTFAPDMASKTFVFMFVIIIAGGTATLSTRKWQIGAFISVLMLLVGFAIGWLPLIMLIALIIFSGIFIWRKIFGGEE